MSTFLFNKKRKTLKNELKHSGTEKNKKKTKRVPILTRATGFLYGVETRLNKFIETKENFEELFQENPKKDDKVIIDEPSPEYYGQFFELRKSDKNEHYCIPKVSGWIRTLPSHIFPLVRYQTF